MKPFHILSFVYSFANFSYFYAFLSYCFSWCLL
uniref:Uncharacterized protein n=1 Tax=Arundo donax TaxID=35708 RepID=A0A0A9C5P6_ARUDO